MLFMIYFNALYLNHETALYFYAILPWFVYAAMRNTRFQVRETLRDQYRLIAAATIVVQVLKGYVYIKIILRQYGAYGVFDLTVFGVLCIVIAATVVLGLVNYPKVRKAFESEAFAE